MKTQCRHADFNYPDPNADGYRRELRFPELYLMIRGLAVGEIRFKDLFRVIFKEIRIALIVGVVLSVANGIRIYVMYQDMKLAFVIGITIIAIVCMARWWDASFRLLQRGSGLTRH